MIAVTAHQLPESHPGGWAAEPKLDGFRCIAHRSGDLVALQSRQQRQLTEYFPAIVDALGELDVEVVLDGELVLWREVRVDFAALQQRLHPAASRARELSGAMPAWYVVFDILALGGAGVRLEPYSARRAVLEDLLARQLPTPLPRAARAEIGAVLTPAAGDHPWPPAIPSSRFGHLASTPIAYLQVAPTTVVE